MRYENYCIPIVNGYKKPLGYSSVFNQGTIHISPLCYSRRITSRLSIWYDLSTPKADNKEIHGNERFSGPKV